MQPPKDEKLVPLDETDFLAHSERQDQRIRELEAALEAALKENESLKEQIAALKAELVQAQGSYDDAIGEYHLEEQDLRRENSQQAEEINRLEAERDLWKYRAIAVASHLDYEVLCGDIQQWVKQFKTENSRQAEEIKIYKNQITFLSHALLSWRQAKWRDTDQREVIKRDLDLIAQDALTKTEVKG